MKQDNIAFVVFAFSIIAIIVVAVRGNLFRDADDLAQAVKIGSHNFEYQLSPDRRRPFVSVDKEYGLRQLIPGLFYNFDKDDWKEFWDIIYGAHPLLKFKNERLPLADRNLYIQEVQKVLVERYPQGFTNLTPDQWRIFWSEIFGIVDYKMVVGGSEEWQRKQKMRADERLNRRLRRDNNKISRTIQRAEQDIGELDK